MTKPRFRHLSIRASFDIRHSCFVFFFIYSGMHWLGWHRLLVFGFICYSWTGVIVLGHFFPGVPFIWAPWRGEQSFEDLLRREGRTTPATADFVFLAFDHSTLQLAP